MKIFVCVKHVPDTAATIKIAGDNGFEDADLKFISSPYDEYGIEEAVSIAENQDVEVVIITVGKPEAVSTLRTALAMGAHRAILVKTDSQFLDSSLTAKALKVAMEQDGLPDMIFTGKESVDSENLQTQYHLAKSLGMPIVNEVSALSLEGEKAIVQRESEGGEKQVIEMHLPCVVGATKGLNEPRYPKFPDIMKAKKKKIKEMDLSDFDIDASQGRVTMDRLEVIPERSGAKMIDGSIDDQVTELIKILRDEEKVI